VAGVSTRTVPVVGRVDTPRLLATASVGLTMVTYLSVLAYIVTVAGEPPQFYVVVGASLVAATLLARVARPRTAAVVTVGLLAAGSYYYIATLPASVVLADAVGPMVADAVSMLSGLSILRIINAGTWALAIAPAPTLLAWYLAVRRRYLAGAGVAGATLGLFVLTGDAAPATTLVGAVGVAGAAGFGDLASDPAGVEVDEGRRDVLLGLGGIVATASVVDVVPEEFLRDAGSGLGNLAGSGTTEANLLGSADSVDIRGSIDLSPAVRFAVESDEASYWRVGGLDRYTGGGWVRTGEARPYQETNLAAPVGADRQVEQTYTMEGSFGNMPAVWKPTRIERSDTGADVRSDGSLQPLRRFRPDESYTVVSRRPVATPGQLREAGRDYPTVVEDRHTALPGNVPDRVEERTSRITANATNPYDTARVIEQWLSNNRGYSLDVSRPGGTVADAFLFEMSEGYCTYFATTMAVMLRTQGIPARFVVGYTPGEQVDDDRWVVRGLDAHAWVEVYFPEHGWHRFDPTPAGPRQSAEQSRIEDARAADVESVDTNETGPGTPTPTAGPSGGSSTEITPITPGTTPDIEQIARRQATPPEPGGNATAGGSGGSDGGGFTLPDLPPREQLALGAVVALGAVAGARKSGVTGWAYREVWLRRQPRSDPVTDVRGAYERIEYVLSRQTRARAEGETVRQYAEAVGDRRARRAARLYERATYADDVTEAEADEAVALADSVVANRGQGA
jgi:transglutaminase-like putative cysteine protease